MNFSQGLCRFFQGYQHLTRQNIDKYVERKLDSFTNGRSAFSQSALERREVVKDMSLSHLAKHLIRDKIISHDGLILFETYNRLFTLNEDLNPEGLCESGYGEEFDNLEKDLDKLEDRCREYIARIFFGSCDPDYFVLMGETGDTGDTGEHVENEEEITRSRSSSCSSSCSTSYTSSCSRDPGADPFQEFLLDSPRAKRTRQERTRQVA